MTLTVVLNRDDQAGFERYLKALYDPHSAKYRHFLTQAQITARFGPSRASYSKVADYLRQNGFTVLGASKNRLTLTVRARRTAVERAFALGIADYRLGEATFFANDRDPRLPASLARHVANITGLANLAVPHATKEKHPLVWGAICGGGPGISTDMVGAGEAAGIGTAYNLTQVYISNAPAWGVVLYNAAGKIGPWGFAFWLWSTEWQLLCLADSAGVWDIPVNAPSGSSQQHVHFMPRGAFGAAALTNTPSSTVSAGPVNPTAKQYNSLMPRAGFGITTQSNDSLAVYGTNAADGTGQTVGLLEFDTYQTSDVDDYLNFTQGTDANLKNLSVVPIGGGATPGADQDEVLLDIDTVMTLAPGAKVVVYDAPFTGQATSYTELFNAMINGGVTIISNSWSSCEDQVSKADAEGIDQVLQAAAASGISVFNGTGDSGSTCLDGSANTVGVPADSPNATAVGGTTLHLGPGFTYGSETWWDGSASIPATGQGGFGVSRYFARPNYQNGLTASATRSVPDITIDADPETGTMICQASGGGCPVPAAYGGTSMSAPEWAAYGALLNEALGKNAGALNPQIYRFANTSAFHTAASMGSDFAHVGLGSPNIDGLYLSLTAQSAGAVSGTGSALMPLEPYSSLLNNNLGSSGSAANIAADGTTLGGVLVQLFDSKGNSISGKTVTLSASAGSARITPATAVTAYDGTAVFTATDLATESIVLTATDATDGVTLAQTATLNFIPPPAASGGIGANPSSVPADGQTAATVVVTLKDSLNRPVPGKTVTLADGSSHAVLTGPTPGVTDANGQIQFAATDQVNETVTFTAVDVTDGNLPIPGSAAVTYSNSIFSSCGVGVVPTPGSGYTITPFITGLPAAPSAFLGGVNATCPSGSSPTFTSSGAVLVSDTLTGGIYQLGPDGGAVSTSSLLNTIAPYLSGLVYGKDGSAYATVGNVGGQIIQVDPATGAQLAVVASGLTCPAGLSVDPLSGDLFFDDDCTGGGLDNASIWRVIDPANTDPGNPTSVVVYATLPTTPNGLMAFAPNGTLYAVSGYFVSPNAQVEQVSPTSATGVTVTPVNGITSDYAVAIGKTNPDGSAQSLIVEPAGTLSEIPIADPAAAVVLGTGSPGVGVIGPDGCMYTAHYDTVYRLANSSGPCTFTPTTPAPLISLSPTTVSPSPAQGGSQTFTARVQNISPLAGVPVIFQVRGSNRLQRYATTDANGNATMSYTSLAAGRDTIVAISNSSHSPLLVSNSAQIMWTAGPHVTFLTLNPSVTGATVKQSATVTASLADISTQPAAPIPGETITFTLGAATCSATTDGTGKASCPLSASQSGTNTLTAKFAGTSQFVAAADSIGFNVSAPPTPPPTVQISVSPANAAAGGSATLTWSSTGATACTASGSWSGSEPTGGTQTVTPATTGSFTYTLTCTGNGGSAAASAVLSATLVKITVTAKAGGGAMSVSVELLLGLLVMMRLAPALRRRRTRDSVAAALVICASALIVGSGSARAQAGAAASPQSSWLDPFYIGIRVGGMPVRMHAGQIDAGLNASGFSGVTAATDTSAAAGTMYIGYELASHADLEFGYTYRDSKVATLDGTIASIADVPALLRETTGLIRGYGNIFALSFRSPFELAPRFTIVPRVGAFVWDTKVTAVSDGASFSDTHRGGGLTAGVGFAYRVWQGLWIGVGADIFRGSPDNIATLYGGSIEWRFGR